MARAAPLPEAPPPRPVLGRLRQLLRRGPMTRPEMCVVYVNKCRGRRGLVVKAAG